MRMGWSIDLKLSGPIPEDDLDRIVRQIPCRQSWGVSRQPWGWSHVVDISLRSRKHPGDEVHLSGSFTASGRIAELFALALAGLLRAEGYDVAIGEMTRPDTTPQWGWRGTR